MNPAPKAGSGLAIAGLVLTSLLWGGMIPMTHALATEVFDPFFLALIRYLLPAGPLFLLCLAIDRHSPFKGPLPRQPLVRLGAMMACFSLMFTFGIMLSDPISSAIVISCGPLIATVLSKLLYRVPLARGFGMALLAAVVGGALVAVDAVRPRAEAGGGIPYLGELLLIGAQLSWTLYSLKAQEWLVPSGWSQLRISFLTSLAGAGYIIVAFLVINTLSPGRLPSEWPSMGTWFMLAWMALGGAGAAIVLWNYGVSHVGVPVASLYGNLAPVFSVLVAALFFGAAVSPQQIIGGAVILAGILRMQWLRLRPA